MTLEILAPKAPVFQVFPILAALAQKAKEMQVAITVHATVEGADAGWFRNAIAEPLGELERKGVQHKIVEGPGKPG